LELNECGRIWNSWLSVSTSTGGCAKHLLPTSKQLPSLLRSTAIGCDEATLILPASAIQIAKAST
jgi:hypothetical protein